MAISVPEVKATLSLSRYMGHSHNKGTLGVCRQRQIEHHINLSLLFKMKYHKLNCTNIVIDPHRALYLNNKKRLKLGVSVFSVNYVTGQNGSLP